MPDINLHWEDEDNTTPQEVVVKYYVYQGLPIQLEIYKKDNVVKAALIPEIHEGEWRWVFESDLINLHTDKRFKDYGVSLDKFQKALDEYKRTHRHPGKPLLPRPEAEI